MLDLKEAPLCGVLMVSLHVCYAFVERVKDIAHPYYKVRDDPQYHGGVCHVALANTTVSPKAWGDLTLYADGSLHLDVPRRIRDLKHTDELIKELEGCGCQDAWFHPHLNVPGLSWMEIQRMKRKPSWEQLVKAADKSRDVFHYHCNAPPSLSARQCAVKKILEEP